MRLGAIVLPVTDLVRSRRWYEEHLGLSVVEDDSAMGMVMFDSGTGAALCLMQAPPDQSAAALAGGVFPVLLVDDVAAALRRLGAEGVACGPLEERGRWRRAAITDPDGHRLDLVERVGATAADCTADKRSHVASDMTVAFSADQPGTLARALEAIKRAGLDTGGYAEIEGYFHLLVPDPAAARRAFEHAGFSVQGDQPVVVVDVATPGATADLFRRVADAGVNVSFTYATADGRLVIGSREPDRLLEVLADAIKPSEGS
jgi:catechol 2,3-dioxygenase-like lactoylglutathione lyase family enzyme